MPGIVPRNLHKSMNFILIVILEFGGVSPSYRCGNRNMERLRFTWGPRGRERRSGDPVWAAWLQTEPEIPALSFMLTLI